MNNVLTGDKIEFPISFYLIQHDQNIQKVSVGGSEEVEFDIGFYIVKEQKINNALQLLQFSQQLAGFIERIDSNADIYTNIQSATTFCNELNASALASLYTETIGSQS